MKDFPRKLAWGAIIFGSFLFVNPSPAFACHRTNMNFPAEGANLNFDSLPGFATARYDTSFGGVYSLELYEGVVGSSTIIAGGFQQLNSCSDDRAEPTPFRADRKGDYFFVLANFAQVDANGGAGAWSSHWTSGNVFRTDKVDHAVSRFTVNATTTAGIDPVIIIPGILGSSDKNGVWVIDPIFHTYDDLIATLKANGYTEGKDLFTMPYDWRQSNVLTAVQLENKIDEVEAICQCAKVDLVAHSMGGLAARQYIQSDRYENDVDQLIFLGTPHLGATFSYLTWEGGETGTKTGTASKKIKDLFTQLFLSREAKKAGYDNLFDYVRNKPIPSVQELLPIYDYLRDKDSNILRIYPNNYPQNAFLENLKTGVAGLLDKARVINIVGELGNNSTLNAIRVVDSPSPPLWENGYPDGFDGSTADRGFEFGFGDGTVPKNSSESIAGDLSELTAEHSALVTKAEGLVFKKLTGKDASILITSNTDSVLDANFKILLIKILSPVDVLITAPDGKKIGKDFATNSEINQIDGAFYSGFLTDDEYITIPNPLDGEYKIETRGTGTGSYTIAAGYISDNISADNDFTANTATGTSAELNLSVNNASPADLEIKPKDTTPPNIAILSPASRDYLRSETLPINVEVSDAESGVFSQTFKFDARIVNNGDSVDLFFEKLGSHKVSANAADFVGNGTNKEVTFRVVATLQSTISDIERAYSLGWITKKSVKNTLIGKLERIDTHNRPLTQKTLKTFISELEREHPKNINDQAYNLLKEDINWLLNNL
ncbi:MAG: hypothetical protein Q8R12_01305 [bacterium]|nr:hypothetical protein [bacterium]